MRRRPQTRCAAQAGFTLVELLVGMLAGVVVLFGATSLMIVALHFSGRISDRVAATQQSRTAMEQLMQELQSGCLTSDVSPVQASTAAGISPTVDSDGTHLVFVSGLGDSATATPTEHVVSIQNGALVDASYSFAGGSPPALNTPSTWTFNATPAQTRTLLAHVSQIDPNTPLFQYYSYSNSANPTANSLLNAVALSATPLSSANAPAVAEVAIAWQAAPPNGLTDSSRVVQMNDSVVFRQTPASPGTNPNYPCD